MTRSRAGRAIMLIIAGIPVTVSATISSMAVSPAQALESPEWSDSYMTRVEAEALLQTLNATLLASPSATLTLENWCRDHRLADNPRIVAHRDASFEKAPSDEVLRLLAIKAGEQVKYRHVELTCGDKTLSEADNWYVPSRLTAEMNRQLQETDTPFGKVIRPLEPYRRTFSATLLWHPLPNGWETGTPVPATHAGRINMPDHLLEHKAIVLTRTGLPISFVDERYTKALFEFPLKVPE